jgi:TolB-like protein/DNA-binding winged helix-turn-helix (wHTH) protein/Flp pilus assembly protein TadD
MSKQAEDLLEFDVYRIDVGQRVLLSRGNPVLLSPKVFDTLLVLAEQPGRVLQKDYLLKKVWPDSFVEEGSLARNVHTLRRVLGPAPDGQEYIETIPTRGYRFKALVRRVSDEHAAPASPDGVPDEVPTEADGRGLPEAIGHERAQADGTIIGRPAIRPRVMLAWGIGFLLVIASSVAGWRLLPATERPHSITSLAVLPFRNVTGNQDIEYFSDGLTEELINALSNIPDLQVVSRTTVFQFKNRAGDIRELGRRMNVDAIMEGSVRREDDRIRVTVQLNSARDGYHYWSRTWDSGLRNVFAIQQEIAQQVALSFRRSEAGVVAAGRPLTSDLEAYNLYLQGQFHRRRASATSLNKAAGFYRQAIERDPRFAEAYVGLAILFNQAATDGRLSPSEAVPQSKAALAKAIELNPVLPSAYAVQGWISTHFEWDWVAAERNLRRAIDLDPTDPESHHSYSHFLLAMGRFPESLAESQRAIELDPLNAEWRSHLALHFDLAREFAKAIDTAKIALDLDPGLPDGWNYSRIAYEFTDHFEEAINARSQLGQPPESIAALRTGLAAAGAQGYWRALRDSELARSKNGQASARTLALAYARLGDRRDATEWLERAIQEREGWVVYLNVNPAFDGLRGDRRFEDLVTRVGLPGRR